MTPADFKRSLDRDQPPPGASSPLRALWWVKRGDWDKAHAIVMDADDPDSAWVHAHLHRAEGDIGNADYWYRQARRRAAIGSLDDEWDAIVAALL
jgi:hypothetical protein